jgi:hypothetical protein
LRRWVFLPQVVDPIQPFDLVGRFDVPAD